jgi:hypothetical protein
MTHGLPHHTRAVWGRWIDAAIAWLFPKGTARRKRARLALAAETRQAAEDRARRDGWRPVGQRRPDDHAWLHRHRRYREKW